MFNVGITPNHIYEYFDSFQKIKAGLIFRMVMRLVHINLNKQITFLLAKLN